MELCHRSVLAVPVLAVPVLAVHLHTARCRRPSCEPGDQAEQRGVQLVRRDSNPLQVSSSLDLEKTKVMNLLNAGCCLSCCTTALFGHQLEEAGVKAETC